MTRNYKILFINILQIRCFLSDEVRRCIKADRISLEHLTRNNVSDFLHWTEENKGCGTATRNQKLSAFHTFCKYMLYTDIFHLDQWQSILSIKSKHCEKQSVSYLSIDGIRLLFLTSSPCHPKIIREQWCDALMPFHEHGSSNGLFIPGQRHLYCHNSPGKFEHLVHTHVYV